MKGSVIIEIHGRAKSWALLHIFSLLDLLLLIGNKDGVYDFSVINF